MIIKNANTELEIDHGDFVYFAKTVSTGLGESTVEDQHVDWSVVPTTVVGGGPKIAWDVQTERTASGITYWIIIRNVGSQTISYEAKYSITR